MATKTDDKKLYKKTRAEYLELKQQFEILQESFGKALDKIAELERRPAKELKKIPELERKLAKALKKISELERKLAQHDNAHTPSSKKGHRPEGKTTTWKAAAKRQRQKWHGKTARRAEGTQGSHVQARPNAL